MSALLRRGLLLFAGSVLVAGLVVLPVTSASAHDQLLGSSPASGERVETGPASVELQFSDDVLTVGAVIVVADESGKDWVANGPILEGSLVRVNMLPEMPEAGYEIRWRVVSSDGHPISGLIPFTVGDGEPFSSVSPGNDPSGNEAAPELSEREVDDGLLRILLIGGGGAAAAVAIFVVIEIILRRRRAASDEPDAGPSNHTT